MTEVRRKQEEIQKLKELACGKLDEIFPQLQNLGKYLHDHPELSTKEFLAAKYIKDLLKEYNFQVEDVLQDKYDTAFWARAGQKGKGIGFLAEYDALPELGHGCGHNLIAMIAVGAGIVFKDIMGDKAESIIYGCAAEETLGAKIYLAEENYFDPVKAALIIHPDDGTTIGGTSYATHPLEFKFIGAEAHVADPEYHGINALDMLVDFYQEFKLLRQTFTEPHIIGNMIVEGGKAPNIIPGVAIMRSTIRSTSTEYLEEVMLPEIKKLAEKVAARYGGQVKMEHYEPLYKNLLSDKQLEKYYANNFRFLGEDYKILPPAYADGSTDVGNVSHVTRSCQPTIGISAGEKLYTHTKEFACATGSDYAYKKALLAAKAMVMTAIDVIGEEI